MEQRRYQVEEVDLEQDPQEGVQIEMEVKVAEAHQEEMEEVVVILEVEDQVQEG